MAFSRLDFPSEGFRVGEHRGTVHRPAPRLRHDVGLEAVLHLPYLLELILLYRHQVARKHPTLAERFALDPSIVKARVASWIPNSRKAYGKCTKSIRSPQGISLVEI